MARRLIKKNKETCQANATTTNCGSQVQEKEKEKNPQDNQPRTKYG